MVAPDASQRAYRQSAGGYAFARYFAQGRGAFTTNNRVDIGNGPYLALNGSYRW